VELRLYPLYVCWYEKNAGKRFAICDGITGNVDIPQQKSSWGVFRSLLIMAAVGLVIYFSKGLFVGGDSLNPSATAKAPTQVVTATIMNKELLPAVKTPDKQNQQNHGVSQVIAAVKNVIHKPLKKTIPVNQGNPSFNCSEASFKAEKLICASKELADDDRKLAASYELKKQSTSFEIVKKQVILEQTNWIEHVRNACTDEACLVEAYHKRMGILSQPNQVKKTEVCPIPGHC
jgi:uncharacterized protein YecT (DUF1311 family)